mmetsp:Transcript_38637/g.84027  ORF Transcript_38637/g.84027 Transcript_38637/m.84027 type:complete len:151 (+) Transcript_38637:230-682(+)
MPMAFLVVAGIAGLGLAAAARSSTTACCYELGEGDASDGENQEELLPTSTRPALAESSNQAVPTHTQTVAKKRKKEKKSKEKETKGKEPKNSKTPCAICYDDCRKTILAPCGHKALCKGCTHKLISSTAYPRCPICRKGVQSYIEKEYRV